MSTEISVFIRKKGKDFMTSDDNAVADLTFDNIEDKCTLIDYFSGSWILFSCMREVGFNMDDMIVLTPKFYFEVESVLKERISTLKQYINDYENFTSRIKNISCDDIQAALEGIKETREDLKECREALGYWRNLYGFSNNFVDVIFTFSY